MKLSVIATFYNCEEYVRSCLDSILQQDYDNFEIIAVDDGSTDDTRTLLQEYIDRGQIRHCYHEHQGVSEARNAGIDMAQGEFIMFVDGDDKLSPSILSTLAKAITDETDIIACTCTAFDDNNYTYQCHFFEKNHTIRTLEEKEELFAQLIHVPYGQEKYKAHTAIGVPWGKLYRKQFLQEHMLRFEPELIRMQDNIFNMYAFYAARCIIYLDQPLYMYRLTHIRAFKLQPELNYRVLSHRNAFFEKYPEIYSEKLQQMFMREIMLFLLKVVKWFASNDNYTEFCQHFEQWRSQPLCEQAVGSKLKMPFKKRILQFLIRTRKKHLLFWYFRNKK